MTFPTFSPSRAPSLDGYQKTIETRFLTAGFGGGYEQRAGDGLNPIRRKVTLVFNAVSGTVADELQAFYEARNGPLDAWKYTLPDEATQRVWRFNGEINVVPMGNDVWSVSFEAVEIFDIE